MKPCCSPDDEIGIRGKLADQRAGKCSSGAGCAQESRAQSRRVRDRDRPWNGVGGGGGRQARAAANSVGRGGLYWDMVSVKVKNVFIWRNQAHAAALLLSVSTCDVSFSYLLSYLSFLELRFFGQLRQIHA